MVRKLLCCSFTKSPSLVLVLVQLGLFILFILIAKSLCVSFGNEFGRVCVAGFCLFYFLFDFLTLLYRVSLIVNITLCFNLLIQYSSLMTSLIISGFRVGLINQLKFLINDNYLDQLSFNLENPFSPINCSNSPRLDLKVSEK